jgi:L-ascorbate 6-phosphate lactonase
MSDDLLNRIQNSSSDRVLIWGLAGAGFAIQSGGEVIFIDPYLSIPDPTRPFHRLAPVAFSPERIGFATAVISTHEHNDHCDPNTLRAFATYTEAPFIGPSSSCRKAEASGYPASRIVMVRPGDERSISESFNITAFPSNDPYEPNAVTFVIRTPRGNIFHGGDTSYFDGFARVGGEFQIDVALLSFGKQIPSPERPFYMDAVSVAKAARDLRAKVCVPMHWNLWVEGWDDPGKVKAELSRLSPNTAFRIIDVKQVLEL